MFKKILVLLIIFSSMSGASAWYDPNWGYRIPVSIDNTGNVSLTAHRFDVSIASGINESSIRVVNDSSGLVVAHWAENVSLGVCYGLWFNGSVDSGVSENYYIYYGNDNVSSTSSYNDTFGDGIVLDTPLTSRYADGNTMIDRSPYGNNGTNHGATVGSDYSEFDGIDDYVNYGNDTSLGITGNISISFRGKLPVSQEQYATVVGRWITSPDKRTYVVMLDSNQVQFYLSSNGGAGWTMINYIPAIYDIWTHTTATYDGTIMRIYENGIEKDSVAYSAGIYSTPTQNLLIGGRISDRNINGSVSDTRIYNRALTSTQITSLYEQGNTTPSVTLQSVEGLLPPPSIFQNSVTTLTGFPTAVSSILSSFLQYLPLFVGILISGFLIIICVGVFGKLKRW